MNLQEIHTNKMLLWGMPFIFFVTLITVVRCSALDHYEKLNLIVAQFLCKKFLKIKLQDNFGYPLYRAFLSVNEAQRLKINLNEFKSILIHIEDKSFLRHKGISFKAIVRALRDYFFKKKGVKSGGSTITQQLIRTLFIIEYSKKFRRKLVELFLSRFWIEKLYSKDEILYMYLCSVRYENKIFGIAGAIKHFFPNKKFHKIASSEVFFLIERIANLHSSLLVGRVLSLIESCKNSGLISDKDIHEIKDIYFSMKNMNKIKCNNESLKKLEDKITEKYPI